MSIILNYFIGLPPNRRLLFERELSSKVDKQKLHSEVLEGQEILDFDTYQCLMALVSADVTELSL